MLSSLMSLNRRNVRRLAENYLHREMRLNGFLRKLLIFKELSSFIPGNKLNGFTAQVLKKQLSKLNGNQGAAEWSSIQFSLSRR